MADRKEFWAELLEVWFFKIGPVEYGDPTNFRTVEEFIEYDPMVGELIQEWFIHVPMQDYFSADAVMARENQEE